MREKQSRNLSRAVYLLYSIKNQDGNEDNDSDHLAETRACAVSRVTTKRVLKGVVRS